jgi:hypothetical protein
MPKGFKLPGDFPKYDGQQEPGLWLKDYLSSIRFQRGTSTTAMKCLQLQLKGSTHAWLKSLPPGSIKSWEDLVYDFVQNFQATYKRPASVEQLPACTQRNNESIRSYIRRWINVKNSARTTLRKSQLMLSDVEYCDANSERSSVAPSPGPSST